MSEKQLNKLNPVVISENIRDHESVSFFAIGDYGKEDIWFDIHYELEMGILCEGSMERIYPGHSKIIGPGQVWFSGMWEQHACKILRQPCKGIVAFIDPRAIQNLNTGNEPFFNWAAPFVLPPAERPQITGDLQRREMVRLAKKYKQKIEPYPETQRGRLAQGILFLEILQLLYESSQESFTKKTPGLDMREKINPALQMVMEDRKFISVRKAAQACSMNANSFCKHFEKLMGMSFARFALESRIKGAAYELMKTGKSIEEVADLWGFSDVSHFYRIFQKEYDCTPVEYRRKLSVG